MFGQNDPRNKVTADDKEDIDTDISSFKPVPAQEDDFGVIKNNTQNCYGSEAIDFGPVIDVMFLCPG